MNETLAAGNSQMQAALDAGVDAISLQQDVVFRLYRKFVFSQDGSVFWVATPTTLTVTGALHYATDRLQNEDETLGQNLVLLTAEQEVTAFNVVAPGTMWIGSWPLAPSYADQLARAGLETETGTGIEAEGGEPLLVDAPVPALQVAFGQRAHYFGPADLYHYSGFAVFPALSTQIVSSPDELPEGPIVSNSLPIWLALNDMALVYPSFLVPDNVSPPYIVAHVEPSGTEPLQAFPVYTWPGSVIPDSGASPLHSLPWSQLLRDEVDLTLYGFNAQEAARYLASLFDASLNAQTFGFANSPAVRDAKRTQVELTTLAQKKTIHISANYYLNVASVVALRLLLEAFVSEIYTPGGRAPEGQGATYQAEQLVVAAGLVRAAPEGQGATVQDVQTVTATGTVEG